jgi:hypothetical protein
MRVRLVSDSLGPSDSRKAPLLVLVLLSCGGGGNNVASHVEISGKPPSEGAAIAAGAVCARQAQCGQVSIACMGSGSGGGSGSDASMTNTCTATIRPVKYDDCYMEAGKDIADLLSCPALTAAQVDELELCFDMIIAPKCITQAEADAQARAAETGQPRPSVTPPPECALLVHPPSGC